MVSQGFKNLGDEERGLILKKALQELNEDEALLINLYYWQECAMAEVADVTGLEENFIKVKIHRARSKLLKILSESMGIRKEDVL
jgi:RNA polymerase sigma-70 factor (ECF subfamily)